MRGLAGTEFGKAVCLLVAFDIGVAWNPLEEDVGQGLKSFEN